jgi:hypothetical protein
MDQLPLHVILGGDLVEVAFHQRDLGCNLLCTAAPAASRGVGAIEGRADKEVLPEGFRERRGFRCLSREAAGKDDKWKTRTAEGAQWMERVHEGSL